MPSRQAPKKNASRKRSHLAQQCNGQWRVPYKNSKGQRRYMYLTTFGQKHFNDSCFDASTLNQREANALAKKFIESLGADPGKRDRGKAPMLVSFLSRYIRNKKSRVIRQTVKGELSTARSLKGYFVERFGKGVRLDQIDPCHATDWVTTYRQGHLDKYRRGPQAQHGVKSETTVCSQIRNAKMVFAWAVKENLIGINPFKHLNQQPPTPDKDWHFVEREELSKLLASCQTDSSSWQKRRPHAAVFWKAAIGLARLGGLRRSEILRVKVTDVELVTGDDRVSGVHVYGKKTARKKRTNPYRFVPIGQELEELLTNAINALEPGEEFVISRRYISSVHTLNACIKPIFKRAEVNGGNPWPAFWQTCRKSRATELAEAGIPISVHCEVLGHTPGVAEKFYLKTRFHILSQVASV